MSLSDEEIRSRGIQAENLLKDEMLREALQQVMYAAHRAFEAAKGDPDKLRRASDLLEMAAEFRLYLQMAINQGRAVSKKIDAEMQASKARRTIRGLVRNREAYADEAPWSAAG